MSHDHKTQLRNFCVLREPNGEYKIHWDTDNVPFEGGCLTYPENMNEGKLLDLVLKGMENLWDFKEIRLMYNVHIIVMKLILKWVFYCSSFMTLDNLSSEFQFSYFVD